MDKDITWSDVLHRIIIAIWIGIIFGFIILLLPTTANTHEDTQPVNTVNIQTPGAQADD